MTSTNQKPSSSPALFPPTVTSCPLLLEAYIFLLIHSSKLPVCSFKFGNPQLLLTVNVQTTLGRTIGPVLGWGRRSVLEFLVEFCWYKIKFRRSKSFVRSIKDKKKKKIKTQLIVGATVLQKQPELLSGHHWIVILSIAHLNWIILHLHFSHGCECGGELRRGGGRLVWYTFRGRYKVQRFWTSALEEKRRLTCLEVTTSGDRQQKCVRDGEGGAVHL